jgi:FkbM family methyltransferase
MTDTKTGFIVTYFKTSEQGQQLLENLIDTISRENYYLVLASHSPISQEIQEKCDFYIFQEQNIVDDRKYSHGVAESNLIELALHHLRYKKIDWTYKVSYDVVIKDVSRFNDWRQDYKYNFVSCNWGNNILCTNSFFANVDFIIKNIDFYDSIDSMFAVNNVIENCWEKNIRDRGLVPHVFSYKDKAEFFGPHNLIDTLFYDYNKINFTYSEEEKRFYIQNNTNQDLNVEIRIFDYYTDLCLFVDKSINLAKDVMFWICPTMSASSSILPWTTSKNGYYLEVYLKDIIIRKNILIKDFNYKHLFSNKFKKIKLNEPKFIEYFDFDDFNIYKKFDINLDNIRNYVDIGSNYGLSGISLLERNVKTYMIEADANNYNIIRKIFDDNTNIKIINKAVHTYDGFVDFYENPVYSEVSSIYETTGNKTTVECISPNTLVDLIDEDFIDLMKIDIEGSEYDFFNTITDENLKKINRIIIEFHNNEDYKVMDILEKLTFNDYSFKLEKFDINSDNFIIGNKMGIIYAYRQI